MDLLPGTLDMLVLRTLRAGGLHGYAIARAIRDASGDSLKIEFGSLYPALKRLEVQGWIASIWETSEHNRRAKVYRITPAGKRQLLHERSQWENFVRTITRIMDPVRAED
jgi:PadR family transcriptional regulator PadR